MQTQPSEPKGLMIYLAGPIDGVSVDEAGTWRGHARQLLTFRGFISFNPSAAFHVGRINSDQIHHLGHAVDGINRTAIKYSAAILASIAPGQDTIGTWREIEFARSLGKQVFLVCPNRMHHMALHDIRRHPDLESAIHDLNEYFSPRQETINLEGFGNIVVSRLTREQVEAMRNSPDVLRVEPLD